MDARDESTVADRVGGEPVFRELVDRFYDGVAADPDLRAMYPDDLEPGKEHLALFLLQFFGGPPTYSERRGHPRLRARHLPFPIDTVARDSWVAHMTDAVRSMDFEPDVETAMLDYFAHAATFMINMGDGQPGGDLRMRP